MFCVKCRNPQLKFSGSGKLNEAFFNPAKRDWSLLKVVVDAHFVDWRRWATPTPSDDFNIKLYIIYQIDYTQLLYFRLTYRSICFYDSSPCPGYRRRNKIQLPKISVMFHFPNRQSLDMLRAILRIILVEGYNLNLHLYKVCFGWPLFSWKRTHVKCNFAGCFVSFYNFKGRGSDCIVTWIQ